MNKTAQRLVVLVLVLCLLLLPCSSVFAYADEMGVVGIEYRIVDNQVIVDVSILKNPGIISFKTSLSYDDCLLKLTSVNETDLLGESYCSHTAKGLKKNPYILIWYDYFSRKSDITGTGIVATLTFDVLGNIQDEYDFDLILDAENITNVSSQYVQFSKASNVLEYICNQNTYRIPASLGLNAVYAVKYDNNGKFMEAYESTVISNFYTVNVSGNNANTLKLIGVGNGFIPTVMNYTIIH